jgi:hypothetical protein
MEAEVTRRHGGANLLVCIQQVVALAGLVCKLSLKSVPLCRTELFDFSLPPVGIKDSLEHGVAVGIEPALDVSLAFDGKCLVFTSKHDGVNLAEYKVEHVHAVRMVVDGLDDLK